MEEKAKKKPQTLAKKKRGVWHLLRVTTFMVRRGFAGKPVCVNAEVAGDGILKNIVGAVRPLHHVSSIKPLPPPLPVERKTKAPEEHFHDVSLPPPAPERSDSECGMTSRYASAENLEEMDRSDDDSIDLRAEEFIANFYAQMRLQRLDSINRYNATMDSSAHLEMGAESFAR